MTFLNPTLLAAGLACVALPILIHLLRRRRRPVKWAAMRFIIEAYRRKRRWLRVEQWLLLALRCLLVAAVGLALGRPLLAASGLLDSARPTLVYLLIDNSLSSSALDESGNAGLQGQLARAERVLAGLSPARGDRAALIALGSPADPLVLPASTDLAAVRALARDLAPTDGGADLEGALTLVRADLDRLRDDPTDQDVRVVVLSDFLLGSADLDRALPALAGAGAPVVLASRPASAAPANVQITAVQPLRPVLVEGGPGAGAGTAPVRVALRRSDAAQPAVSKVRVRLEGSRHVSEQAVRWAQGQGEAETTLSVDLTDAGAGAGSAPPGAAAPGAGRVLLAEIDRDAVAADNARRRVIEVRSALRVGLVTARRFGAGPGLAGFAPSDWLRAALNPSGAGRTELELVEFEPAAIDRARLAGLDALLIPGPDALGDEAWRRVRAFADAGGLVVVTPPHDASVHLWPDAMVRELGLAWSIAREPTEVPPDVRIAPDRAGLRADDDPLALIAAELGDLAAPVRVSRLLGVDERSSVGSRVLRLSDGRTLMLAASPGSGSGAGESGPGAGLVAGPEAGRGLVVYLATALSVPSDAGPGWTDLPAKPLMVPLVQETVRQGVGRARGSFSGVAGRAPVLPAGTRELRPLPPTQGPRVPVDASGVPGDPLRRAGLWSALDASGVARAAVAVNADADAGRTQAQNPDAVRTWLAGVTPGVPVAWLDDVLDSRSGPSGAPAPRRDDDPGQGLSFWLLLAAAGLALAELALARWTSHAYASREGVPA